ncbi:MAG: DNA polymerase IV [Bacteroidetes bacterium GWE2_42_24]|nr:MAG: DNA polymerase IV [Bacteroidetes bacterium GWE2_42_24]OFY30615.1 MAG: DNA polymerase IV [Bacteroidetes bacterium GWF2_43_11]
MSAHDTDNERRTIAHLDLDSFFVSVERLLNNRLRDRPVIIGGLSDRGVVSACSYEARSFGVHSAMPARMARQLCPDAIFMRGDMELYSRYSRMVTDIIADRAPVFEKASIDEHYLDITGMDRFFGSQKWTHELRNTIIRETGLPISCGLSINKTVSKIATGVAKPNGEQQVEKSIVRPFMAPLSIRKIPMLGPKSYTLLRSMGVATIGVLSQLPPDMMQRLMGQNGLMLWKRANGIDHTPIISYSEQKSMSNETTFDTDTTDVVMMRRTLSRMIEKLGYQLRRDGRMTGCVTIKIRYANFDTHTLQKQIPYAGLDHDLIAVAYDLFTRLYTRRILVRLIGLRFSNMVGGAHQLHLFDDAPEMISLYQSLDTIRQRFGQGAVRRGVVV